MKLPWEETKVANLFGDAPIEEYEWIEECPVEWELEKLHEEILWLAEDIIEHDDALEMLWEKIQAVEDDQQQDVENLSNVVEILDCMQKASRMLLDTVVAQNEQIKEFKSKHNSLAWITFANLVWLAVLTVLFWIYVL